MSKIAVVHADDFEDSQCSTPGAARRDVSGAFVRALP